jgi:hypothetical protein
VWQPEFIPAWEAAGPDLTIELAAGQTLVLPRGWVHNPHALNSDSDSIHLTFAIRERTPLWLVEQLVARAIERPEFRRVILPRDPGGARARRPAGRDCAGARRVLRWPGFGRDGRSGP